MKKEYISDVWQLKQKGHENFEFVDIAVNQSRIDDLFKMVENGVDLAHGLSHFCQQLRVRVGGKNVRAGAPGAVGAVVLHGLMLSF